MKSLIRAAPVRKRSGFTAENRACGGQHALTIAARFILVPFKTRSKPDSAVADNVIIAYL